MKILFILPEYKPFPGGGLATYYINLLPALLKRKVSIDVIVGSAFYHGEDSFNDNGINVRSLKSKHYFKYFELFSKFEIFPELRRHLASAWGMYEQADYGKGFDIVETTDWGLNYIPWVINNYQIPVITTLHGSIGQINYFDPIKGGILESDIIRLIESNTLEIVDELHTHSISNRSFWKERLKNDLIYIPPPFTLSGEIKEYETEFNGNPLVVGRIQYWKGPTILSEALKMLGEKAPSVDWIGRDTKYQTNNQVMSSYLKNVYSDIWNNKIKSLGSLGYEEVMKLQRIAKFGIVPSLWDMFNFTCVEFMANGKPVICSSGAGASDLIEDGINGFTYKKNEPEELSQLIRKLNEMPENKLREIGNNAKETIINKLNPDIVAEKKVDRYEYLISDNKVNRKVNDWISRFLTPEHGKDDIEALLDNIPLKKLTKYSLSRIFKRVL
ncbi:MAG: glycosyltransferase family 4 protein [Thermodesulfobacteriota bacterium]